MKETVFPNLFIYIHVLTRYQHFAVKNERRERHRHPDGLHRRHLASRTSLEGVIVPAISKNHSVSLSLVSFVPCFAVKGFVFPSSLATAFCSIDEDSPTVPGCWPMEGVGDGCCGRSRSTDGGLSIGGSTRAAERSTGVPAVGDSTASGFLAVAPRGLCSTARQPPRRPTAGGDRDRLPAAPRRP